MIVGLTGLARSGKQLVADYLKTKYGFKVYDFAQEVLIPEVKRRRIDPTKINLSVIGDELREENGMGILAELLIEKIGKVDDQNIVIMGFRSPEEVDYIRNESLHFYLVEVYSDPLIRYSRRESEDPQSTKEFFERDKRDIENKGMGKVLRMADFIIKNNSDTKSTQKQVDELMKKLGWKK